MLTETSGKLGKPAKPLAIVDMLQVLDISREEQRIWRLVEVDDQSNANVCSRLGVTQERVKRGLAKVYTRLSQRGYCVSSSAIQLARITSGVNSSIRCKACWLTLPCRQDGEDGPCDARSTAVEYLGRYGALLDAIKTGAVQDQRQHTAPHTGDTNE